MNDILLRSTVIDIKIARNNIEAYFKSILFSMYSHKIVNERKNLRTMHCSVL